jgi:hypothetical protein
MDAILFDLDGTPQEEIRVLRGLDPESPPPR